MKKSVLWLSLLLLFLAAIGLKLYIVYFGYLNYHYLVPPGYDAIPHLGIINNLSTTNWGYPKIFHYIVRYLSDLGQRDPFYVLTYWTPVLVVLPSLALFFLLKQIFNLKTAWIAIMFFLFTANYPLYGFVDGNYPNILGYGFFAVFCLAFVMKFIKTRKNAYLYTAVAFYILTGLTHHFSFAELSGILLFSLVTLIIFGQVKLSNLRLNFRIWPTVLLSFGLLLFLLVIYKLYGSLLISFITGLVLNNPAVRDTYLNQAVPFNRYPEIVGPVIWYGGMFGFFYALTTFRSDKNAYTKISLFVWVILIYALSRLPASGLPERFARELAVPLMVFFAYLISRLVNHADSAGLNRRSQFLGYAFMAYLIIINSSLSNTVLVDSLPNSFSKMVWFNQQDQFKSDYLKNNFAPDQKIYINPYANPYVKLMTKANLVDLPLANETVAAYAKIKKRPQKQDVVFYTNLIKDLALGNRGNIFYIFPKPESNPDSTVYPIFSQYDVYNDVMRDIANNQKIIKKFTDGSFIVKIEK